MKITSVPKGEEIYTPLLSPLRDLCGGLWHGLGSVGKEMWH